MLVSHTRSWLRNHWSRRSEALAHPHFDGQWPQNKPSKTLLLLMKSLRLQALSYHPMSSWFADVGHNSWSALKLRKIWSLQYTLTVLKMLCRATFPIFTKLGFLKHFGKLVDHEKYFGSQPALMCVGPHPMFIV